MRSIAVSVIAFTAILVSPAIAQPVPSRDPGTTHIFPAGTRRGTTVKVRVGTECFPPGARLRFWGDGVQATEMLENEVRANYEPSPRRRPTIIPISYPREWSAEVEVAADAEPGVRFWRLSCAQGGSPARPFVIGELPELVESESNSTAEKAERVKPPITINGQIAGERDLDYYVFAARQGDVVVCDVMAGRLGSPLDPILELRDAEGRRVDVRQIHVGSDPVISFKAPRDGDYRLLISHVGIHGGPKYVYRINLTTKPYVYAAFPSGGGAGTTRELEFLALSGTPQPRVLRRRVAFPEMRDTTLRFRVPGGGASEVRLAVGRYHEDVEAAEHGSSQAAQSLKQPRTIHGRLLAAGEEDWYRFTAKKFEKLLLECRRPAFSRARPVLTMSDGQGKRLREVNSFTTDDGSCRIEWICPASGDYYLQVRDAAAGQGGPDCIYRLTVAPLSEAFDLRMPSDYANLLPGGTVKLKLTVDRRGGFEGPIDLHLTGLPKDVKAEKLQIPAKEKEFELTLSADQDARCRDVELRIVGTAMVDGRTVRLPVRAPHAGRDADGTSVGPSTVEHLQLTVKHKPVFRLYCPEAYQYAHRGAVYLYGMDIERLDGYAGDIVLQIGDRQNRDLDGIEMLQSTVPPGEKGFMMPIYLPETMHINAQSQSQLYVQSYTRFTDRHGQKQSLLVVSEKRCLIRSLPTLVKLQGPQQISVQPGRKVRCRLRLERANYDRAMELELIDPPRGISVEKVPIGPGQSTVDVTLAVAANVSFNDPTPALRFRATGRLPKHLRIVTETTVALRSAVGR